MSDCQHSNLLSSLMRPTLSLEDNLSVSIKVLFSPSKPLLHSLSLKTYPICSLTTTIHLTRSWKECPTKSRRKTSRPMWSKKSRKLSRLVSEYDSLYICIAESTVHSLQGPPPTGQSLFTCRVAGDQIELN